MRACRQSLLSAASLLQVSGVREACCVFLAGALSPDNALGIRAFAELHACADLGLCAARFIENHFVEVLDTEEFLALAPDTLAQLLDSDRITVSHPVQHDRRGSSLICTDLKRVCVAVGAQRGSDPGRGHQVDAA